MTTASSTIGAGEAARRLGVSAEYLRYLARADRVQFEMTPYGRVYSAASIEQLRTEREARDARGRRLDRPAG